MKSLFKLDFFPFSYHWHCFPKYISHPKSSHNSRIRDSAEAYESSKEEWINGHTMKVQLLKDTGGHGAHYQPQDEVEWARVSIGYPEQEERVSTFLGTPIIHVFDLLLRLLFSLYNIKVQSPAG